ncbi:MAG TPA: PQQ-binding-like beta-propeller repeat protein [Vicinamibacteria bacterium]
MNARIVSGLGVGLVAAVVLGPWVTSASRASSGPTASSAPAAVSAATLAGAWSGAITHEGETTPFALELVPQPDGAVLVKATIPSMHVSGQAFGSFPLKIEGETAGLGPFSFRYDAAAGTLSGVVPEGLAPVYRIPLVLRRVERIEAPARPAPGGSLVRPAWTYEAGSPLWAGPTYAEGVVYVGGQDGQVHAVEARTGRRLWVFSAGGPVRTRPTVAAGSVYVPADDGVLYKLTASGGGVAW